MAATSGEEPVKVAFYNVENLYDTVPSLFYDDGDYTPTGRLAWDGEKYRTKLDNLKKVVDELSADVLGLAEVENEAVVRDLVGMLGDDYNYIHLTGSDRRGIDLALLYRGDRFVPLRTGLLPVGTTREVLHVEGELAGCGVHLLVCHLPSQLSDERYRADALSTLHSVADSLRLAAGHGRVVVMGDFNTAPSEKAMRRVFGSGGKHYDLSRPFYSPLEPLARKGMGTYAYNGSWRLYDNIFLSTAFLAGDLRYSECGIFIRGWMLEQGERGRGAYPMRTFSGGRYLGGFSDHLPVWVEFTVAE